MKLKIVTIAGNEFISDFPVPSGKSMNEIQEAVSEIFTIKTTFFKTTSGANIVVPTASIDHIEIVGDA